MTLVLILLLIGLLFGLGALFTTAKWLLIILVILWLAALVTHNRSRY